MITAVVLTKNNKETLRTCLSSLTFVDEIVVVDDNSTDTTIRIAKKMGAKVYKRKMEDNFAKQRNFGLKKAKGEWVFFLDADERVSEALASEIYNLQFTIYHADGFYIKRKDKFLGKELKHGETNIHLLRFAKKDVGKWRRKVHEVWEIEGKVSSLNNSIIHESHKDLAGLIDKVNRYSDLHAKQKLKDKEISNLFKIVFYPIAKFINNYIFRLGILDGLHGFVIAILMSMHSFLAWSKLWILQKN